MQRENKILLILVLGIMMGSIDTTIVLLALPSITEGLGANLSLSIWVIVVYLLVVSVATTQLGRLGDLFGRSKMFNLGSSFSRWVLPCAASRRACYSLFSRALSRPSAGHF